MTTHTGTTTHPHLLANYARAPITIVRGESCWLFTDTGEMYLDLVAGIAVCALGHARPEITRVIAEQAGRLLHASNLYFNEPSGALASALADVSGFGRVFFCNSGTEANEAAIKFARKRAFRKGELDRATILACTGSFHGRTLGSLAATDNARYHEGFGPLPAGFAFTPFDDFVALEKNVDAATAAVIIEPVQGESGVHVASKAFLQRARELCDERGALLIFDEIQCGLGRMGTAFAFNYFGVRPDLVTLGKSIANGLPIGAMLVDESLAAVFQPGDHGSTFGGSPVPCAAALEHLRLRKELQLDAHVKRVGALLFDGLSALAEDFSHIFEAPRGAGLILGLPVKAPYEARAISDGARERERVLINAAANNTLRFVPPLVITEDEVRDGLERLRVCVKTS